MGLEQDCLNLSNLHPTFYRKIYDLKDYLEKNENVKIKFSCGYRGRTEQNELYAQGRTKPGSIVTNVKYPNSQHNWGIAVDFYLDMDVDGDGEKSDDAFNDSTRLFELVGNVAVNQFGLGWGGNWKTFQDKPHLYLPNWGSTTKQLVEKYGSPENFVGKWGLVVDVEKTTYYFTDFIRDVQGSIGAKIDGIVGRETISKTPTLSVSENRKHPVVKFVQKRLNYLGFSCGSVDGIYGVKTRDGVIKFQDKFLNYPDGVMDAANTTWKMILKN